MDVAAILIKEDAREIQLLGLIKAGQYTESRYLQGEPELVPQKQQLLSALKKRYETDPDFKEAVDSFAEHLRV